METSNTTTSVTRTGSSLEEKVASLSAMSPTERAIAFGRLRSESVADILADQCGNVLSQSPTSGIEPYSQQIRRYTAHLPRIPGIQRCYASNAESALDERMTNLAVLRAIHPTLVDWATNFNYASYQSRYDDRSNALKWGYHAVDQYDPQTEFNLDNVTSVLEVTLRAAAEAEAITERAIERARGGQAREAQAWLDAFRVGFERAQAGGALSFENAISGGSSRSVRTADNIVGLSGGAVAALDAMDRIRYGNASAREALLRSEFSRAQRMLAQTNSRTGSEQGGSQGDEERQDRVESGGMRRSAFEPESCVPDLAAEMAANPNLYQCGTIEEKCNRDGDPWGPNKCSPEERRSAAEEIRECVRASNAARMCPVSDELVLTGSMDQ